MELKNPISIKVNFIFNAGDPWSRLFDFEKDMTLFLARKGMSAQVVNNVQGQSGDMIIFVRQQTMEEAALPQNSSNMKSPTEQVQKLQKNIK